MRQYRLLLSCVIFLALLSWAGSGCLQARVPQQQNTHIQDITGEYHFLSPEDTLAILDEAGMLKGYVDVYQGEQESDAVLSYTINAGEQKQDHVEFRTIRIHEKYYRFTGKVERGKGHKPGDPDYLRLVGDLQTITTRNGTQENVQHQQVILKSIGKNERRED